MPHPGGPLDAIPSRRPRRTCRGARVEPRARPRYAESPSRRRGRAVSSVGTSARFTRERSLVQVQYRPPSRRTIKEAAPAERAEVAEPADALRSGRSGVSPRASSNLAFGTRLVLALVAQGIERCPAEAEVVGSNPTGRASTLNLRAANMAALSDPKAAEKGHPRRRPHLCDGRPCQDAHPAARSSRCATHHGAGPMVVSVARRHC